MTRGWFPTGQAGQVVPLSAVLLMLGAGLALLVTNLGSDAANQARASAAADASALGAVIDGAATASALAARNGVQLDAVDLVDGVARVMASFGDRVATAEAALLTRSTTAGLNPALAAAITEAERLLGEPVPIVSGYRSRPEQEELWRSRATNPFPVAVPGTSTHERGLAIDVPSGFVPTLRLVAAEVGLCQPLPTTDPVHFELCRTTATR